MHNAVLHPRFDWEWRRVGAWSGSFAAHLIAIALLAAPLAVRTTAPRPPSAPTIVTLQEPPPPALPPPLPPVPPPHAHPSRPTPTPLHAPPQPAPVLAQTSTPSDFVVAAAPSQPAEVAPIEAPATPGIGVAQKLAYEGQLRPSYPAASIRAHEEGTVLLRVLVDAEGAVQRVEIERSSGHSKLDAAAREAVRRGRFRPVMQNGRPMPTWGLVPIQFRLDQV